MTSSPAAASAPRRGRAPLAITAAIIAGLVILFFIFAGLYTDVLWFDQLGFLSVLTTQWLAGTVLFLIGFIGMAVPVGVSIQLAYRMRPVYAKLNSQLDRYQQVIEPLRRLAMYRHPGPARPLRRCRGVHALADRCCCGSTAREVGRTDPQFGLDIAFYLFDLPFYHAVLGFASAVVLISLIARRRHQLPLRRLRVSGRAALISRPARIQIAVTAALYLLLQAISFWLDQYSTLTDAGDLITGRRLHRRERHHPRPGHPRRHRRRRRRALPRHRDHRALAPARHRHRAADRDAAC